MQKRRVTDTGDPAVNPCSQRKEKLKRNHSSLVSNMCCGRPPLKEFEVSLSLFRDEDTQYRNFRVHTELPFSSPTQQQEEIFLRSAKAKLLEGYVYPVNSAACQRTHCAIPSTNMASGAPRVSVTNSVSNGTGYPSMLSVWFCPWCQSSARDWCSAMTTNNGLGRMKACGVAVSCTCTARLRWSA